jgi:phage terminase small subunit
MGVSTKIPPPSDGLNYKQRLFARYVAAGESRAGAARLAGYIDDGAAQRLMRLPLVLTEIDRVTLELEQDQRVSMAQHLARLDHLSKAAEDAGNYAAAVTAAVSQGKASRLYVEQSHVVTATVEPVDLIVERLNVLLDDNPESDSADSEK